MQQEIMCFCSVSFMIASVRFDGLFEVSSVATILEKCCSADSSHLLCFAPLLAVCISFPLDIVGMTCVAFDCVSS